MIKINYAKQASCRKNWKLEFLLEFDALQSIIDTAEDTKIDPEYHKRNVREKLEEKKEQEIKEREEHERDIQREIE